MIPITYIFFLSFLNLLIRVDFVSRRRDSNFVVNIGIVERIGKGDKRQAIAAVKGLFGFYF